jgi:hypothetical protein
VTLFEILALLLLSSLLLAQAVVVRLMLRQQRVTRRLVQRGSELTALLAELLAAEQISNRLLRKIVFEDDPPAVEREALASQSAGLGI